VWEEDEGLPRCDMKEEIVKMFGVKVNYKQYVRYNHFQPLPPGSFFFSKLCRPKLIENGLMWTAPSSRKKQPDRWESFPLLSSRKKSMRTMNGEVKKWERKWEENNKSLKEAEKNI